MLVTNLKHKSQSEHQKSSKSIGPAMSGKKVVSQEKRECCQLERCWLVPVERVSDPKKNVGRSSVHPPTVSALNLVSISLIVLLALSVLNFGAYRPNIFLECKLLF